MGRTGKDPRRITGFVNDGLRFDVLDQGPLDGPPVLLLHGCPERASHWDAVAGLLHEEGLRTLAPDQRGYSPGARPRTRASYRMSKLTGDVVALPGVTHWAPTQAPDAVAEAILARVGTPSRAT